MKVYLGTDHAGYEMKEELKKYLGSLGHEVLDLGADSYEENDDYPDFIIPVAQKVKEDKDSFGIILGASGQGEAICANAQGGVRAIVYYAPNIEIVKLGREHNNANILSLGAHFLNQSDAQEACKLFLETPFSNDERHVRRLAKI